MYALLGLAAAASYTFGGLFMKLSDGLSRPAPSLLIFAFFGLGAALQTFAMRGSQLSVTYVVVLGVEAALAFALGALVFHEGQSPAKLLGTALVLLGIVLLRSGDG